MQARRQGEGVERNPPYMQLEDLSWVTTKLLRVSSATNLVIVSLHSLEIVASLWGISVTL